MSDFRLPVINDDSRWKNAVLERLENVCKALETLTSLLMKESATISTITQEPSVNTYSTKPPRIPRAKRKKKDVVPDGDNSATRNDGRKRRVGDKPNPRR